MTSPTPEQMELETQIERILLDARNYDRTEVGIAMRSARLDTAATIPQAIKRIAALIAARTQAARRDEIESFQRIVNHEGLMPNGGGYQEWINLRIATLTTTEDTKK